MPRPSKIHLQYFAGKNEIKLNLHYSAYVSSEMRLKADIFAEQLFIFAAQSELLDHFSVLMFVLDRSCTLANVGGPPCWPSLSSAALAQANLIVPANFLAFSTTYVVTLRVFKSSDPSGPVATCATTGIRASGNTTVLIQTAYQGTDPPFASISPIPQPRIARSIS